MADAGFPLPASSYKELVKIIQGYGKFGTDASLADIAQLTAIGETTVSGNNRFLLAVGIIQGGKRKSITSTGRELANALEHDLPSEIAAKWRAVVEVSDFLQKIVAAVRIRKGMDEASLETHVAYSAGQPKTPVVSTGAGTVVEILKNSGLLREEGGNLVATAPESLPIAETVQKSLSLSDTMQAQDDIRVTQGSRWGTDSLGGVQLTIEVKVECSPKDLDDLGHKLRKVIRDFNDARQQESGSGGKESSSSSESAGE